MATDTGRAETATASVEGYEIGATIADSLLSDSGQVQWDVEQAIQDREPLSQLADFYAMQAVITARERKGEYMSELAAYDLDMSGQDAMLDFLEGARRGARSVITVKRLRAIAAGSFS
jgi:hypothetical protein